MNQNRNLPVPGEFYRHFKNRIYQIIAIADHSETGETMVVYQALYGDFRVWVRPLSQFMSEVDREKYPQAAQKFRFEKIRRTEDGWKTESAGDRGNVRSLGNAEDRENLESLGSADAGGLESAEEPEAPAPETGGPEAMNPYLLEFFDAMDEKHYDHMLEALAKLAPKITKKELDDIFMVLDLESFEGDSLAQIAEIRRHILRLKKFDGERLR